MKSSTKMFFISLVIVKICIGLIFLFEVEPGSLFWSRDAIASEPEKNNTGIPVPEQDTSDDPKIDLALVVQKMHRLEAREKALERKSADLALFEAEIDKKIESLKILRDEIKARMAQKKAIEQQKIKHLMKAYAAMKPQSAAELIERLDRQLAVELLGNMKGEAAGKILTYVDREKAAGLIEGLVAEE